MGKAFHRGKSFEIRNNVFSKNIFKLNKFQRFPFQ